MNVRLHLERILQRVQISAAELRIATAELWCVIATIHDDPVDPAAVVSGGWLNDFFARARIRSRASLRART